MWLIALVYILLAAYGILMLWYRRSWLQMPIFLNNPNAQFITKVSVIIPARNEGENIANCLQGILAQHYPKVLTQIIVIDDASTDETFQIATQIMQSNTNITVLQMSPQIQGAHKKRAIEAGIAAATGELIICTDADCQHEPLWLSTLVQNFEETNNQFIAAPVMYDTKFTLLSIFQTLDFISLQGITGASVFKQFHTMCNGANIAYTKAAFTAVNGFVGIDKQPTGDDMLLMHKIYKKFPQKISWLKSESALVHTAAAHSWRAFFQQRIRWASKAAYYDDKRIFYVLLLVYFFNVGVLLLAIGSFFSIQFFQALLICVLLKTILELSFMVPVSKFFNKQQWLWYFPLMQPLHIIYTVAAGWLGRFGSYEWKGRVIKKLP